MKRTRYYDSRSRYNSGESHDYYTRGYSRKRYSPSDDWYDTKYNRKDYKYSSRTSKDTRTRSYRQNADTASSNRNLKSESHFNEATSDKPYRNGADIPRSFNNDYIVTRRRASFLPRTVEPSPVKTHFKRSSFRREEPVSSRQDEVSPRPTASSRLGSTYGTRSSVSSSLDYVNDASVSLKDTPSTPLPKINHFEDIRNKESIIKGESVPKKRGINSISSIGSRASYESVNSNATADSFDVPIFSTENQASSVAQNDSPVASDTKDQTIPTTDCPPSNDNELNADSTLNNDQLSDATTPKAEITEEKPEDAQDEKPLVPIVVKRPRGRPAKKKILNPAVAPVDGTGQPAEDDGVPKVPKKRRRTKKADKESKSRTAKDKVGSTVTHNKYTRHSESCYAAELKLAIEMSMKEIGEDVDQKQDHDTLAQGSLSSMKLVKREADAHAESDASSVSSSSDSKDSDYTSVKKPKIKKQRAVRTKEKKESKRKGSAAKGGKRGKRSKDAGSKSGKKSSSTTTTSTIVPKKESAEYNESQLKMSAFEEYLDMSERFYCGKPICQSDESKSNDSQEDDENLFKFDCSKLAINYRVSFNILKSDFRQPQIVDLWGPKEIVLFELGLFKYGKEFHEIQRDIPTKSVKEIVDMYYLWKKTSRYRIWKANRYY
ncbi:hypothetical protein BEWA_041110 [Theileria equi strain WA]|uniref:SANT domain-containing protein n=1 Tax=Theileria equi strain WA TaxID=1537102 RepID=L1LFY3_THEEQ|nr:hypothetical protein BEWA_041110 [Theileria equi strain WA]EKX74073.1 hypothetical protein BEWA_041110 [Theileria equi strain WA]|eukprot:XP_004833525.1 hypothetical protein BEWA_041110 [Theileria equi strain WA]